MTYYLSLGSNLHPRHHYINAACELLEQRCGVIHRRSADYYSMPVGYESEHEYLNICVCLQTDMSPLELLYATQQIERDLGRTQKSTLNSPLSTLHSPLSTLNSQFSILNSQFSTLHYTDRTIDIDLLCAEDEQGQSVTVQTAELLLPHPRMNERAFVTVPLAQIRASF
ncbi:MAG: 2-amino-4-hydroxy-6-hydroxymethyldihydropteridine diphosphokinase [Paludibacteraceae bacterium]|nr:2-amino-4-hydroxy-6-hydroxymethyldihydropteridine diphosphokinase [Paludibacteraceae bacterium]